ncbi:cytochrome P450 [Aestuariibacter sp. A3R04]|uniref:cytochrome P450 n=1 Tax=Aestuariibacter sp. A3R04 TaxID=2841571 RepID=UPI001C08882A|nr:cytochrome P450 [Aestuariibacter sp. A3R04]MBU3021308.1 cytochrome P450 [Aestuariibacter sp. A3R04]
MQSDTNNQVTSQSRGAEDTAVPAKCPFAHGAIGGIGEFNDAFAARRQGDGVLDIDDQNDPVKMVLGLKEVRKAAHNWKTFQSGAKPGRIVVPSEVAIRDIRQIPFEVDPPAHKGFRNLLEPWFKRPLEAEYQAKLTHIVTDMLDSLLSDGQDFKDAVNDIALVVQSRALTALLNVSMDEAATWISWGTHVFRSDDNPLDASKANVLYDYLDKQIDNAKRSPGSDIYSQLLAAEVDGKKLSDEEIKGIMILTFAGGRDTVINALTNTLAYFSENKEDLALIRQQPELVNNAVEELIRYFSPLTHMGRVATQDGQVNGHDVARDTRISLCWASANRDETVFENPNTVDLTRKANPHVGFGFGIHNCLGATHARALLRIWVLQLAKRVSLIEVGEYEENIEQWSEVQRKVGFHQLEVRLHAL